MKRVRARPGFTLVELLVVIAIIIVLIAIALPVFSRARERARQATCMANLQQIAMAMRMYRMDMGHYPGPYDPVTGEGGLNALYPSYLSDRRAFICPDDLIESGEDYVAQKVRIYSDFDAFVEVPYTDLLIAASSLYTDIDPTGEYWINLWVHSRPDPPSGTPYDPAFFVEHYSSYNDLYNWVGYVADRATYSLCDRGSQYLNSGDNLGFWYAWHRWDPDDELRVWSDATAYAMVEYYLHLHLAQQTYWRGYDPWDLQEGIRLQDNLHRGLWDPGNPGPMSYDYMPYGIPSPVFPGLINRNAPDNTLITRCIHHRPYTVVRTPIRGSGRGGGRGPRSRGGGGPPGYEEEIVYGDSPRDIALRLGGSADWIAGLNYDWAVQPTQTE
jgi:prepilin-type N-terminal cleavage/methylation domain-containing protein